MTDSTGRHQVEQIADSLRSRAALVGTFDPLELLGVPPESPGAAQALGLLADDVDEVLLSNKLFWRMTDQARRRELSKLATGDDLGLVIAQTPPRPEDRFGTFLQAALREGGRDFRTSDVLPEELGELTLAKAFVATVAPAGGGKLGADLEPGVALVRKAEEDRLQHVAPVPLIGRASEISALLSYITSGDIKFPLRMVSAPPSIADVPDKLRPVLVTGIGGAGKSALIADLIRTIRRDDWTGPVVVSLDFDRPNVVLGFEREWTEELTRQIAYSRPELDPKMADIRRLARMAARNAQSGTATLSVVNAMLDGLSRALQSAQDMQELVIVLDTFEELVVQCDMTATDSALEDMPFGLVLAWIDQLNDLRNLDGTRVFKSVRAIVAGRVNPFAGEETRLGHWFAAHLEVGEFDEADAAEFLQRRPEDRDIFTAERSARVASLFPRYPMILKLVTMFARDRDGSDVDEILDTGRTGVVLGDKNAAYALYSRFLERVKDHRIDGRLVSREDLKRLARPGLILLTVTPRLVQSVLAVPCGLGTIDEVRARDLFLALAHEVWLVESAGPDTVRHPSALRRIMLPMLVSHPEAREVQRAAVAWYRGEGAGEPDAAALAAYYLAFADDVSAIATDSALAIQVSQIAGEDILFMPLRASAVLRQQTRSSGALSEAETAALPDDQRSRAFSERRQRQVKSGVVDRQTPPNSTDLSPPAPSPVSTRSTRRFDILLEDPETATRVSSAFASGELVEAEKVGSITFGALRRSDEPWVAPRATDLTQHWIWKWALSCLATGVKIDMPNPVLMDDTRSGLQSSMAWPTIFALASGRAPPNGLPGPFAEYPRLLHDLRFRSFEGPPRHGSSASFAVPTRLVRTLDPVFLPVAPTRRTIQPTTWLSRQWQPEWPNSVLSVFIRYFANAHIDTPSLAELHAEVSSNDNVMVMRPLATNAAETAPYLYFVRGRSSDIYDPVRAGLGDFCRKSPAEFLSAVDSVRTVIPLWPTELDEGRLTLDLLKSRQAEFAISRLVEFFDLCGALTRFVCSLRNRQPLPRRLRLAADLAERYDAILLHKDSKEVGHP